MAWLSGYSKRKRLPITGGTSGAQTDYPLKLAVSYVAAMQGDFDDIRFTQADGTTLIDAWAEVIVTDTSATVWVEFPTTPANTIEQDYYMYYGDGSATSDWDGDATFEFFDSFEEIIKWDRYASNPILESTGGTWDAGEVTFPYSLKVGSTYYLYYSGGDNEIGLATGADGKTFTKITDGIGGTSKVLAHGGSGAWDEGHTWSPTVVYHNSTYYLFYTGREPGGAEDIGVATSSDGKDFTKYASNPILPHGGTGWRQYHLCHLDVVWDSDNSKWIMLVSGMEGSPTGHETIGRYYCSEAEFPYTWHEDAGNPVINYGEQSGVDDYHCLHPKIYPEKVDGKWYVYYTSTTAYNAGHTISRATTTNLYTGSFTKEPNNPIISAGSESWENNVVLTPCLNFKLDDKYALYYTGNPTSGENKTGLIQADNIDDYNMGEFPGSGWTITGTASATAKSTEQSVSPTHSVKQTGSTGEYRGADGDMGSQQSGMHVYDFRVRPTANNVRTMAFISSNTAAWPGTNAEMTVLIWFFETGQIVYYDGTVHNIQSYNANQWYHLEIILKPATKKFDMKIDGVTKVTDGDFIGTEITPRYVHLHNRRDSTGVFYLDDFIVRKYVTNPATYAFGSEESEPTGNPFWYYEMIKRRNR